jgi:hypothetical protein
MNAALAVEKEKIGFIDFVLFNRDTIVLATTYLMCYFSFIAVACRTIE